MPLKKRRRNPDRDDDRDHLLLDLDTTRELFIAPDFDPFSKKETEYMGQSAMDRLSRQLQPGWTIRARHLALTIRLPPDQITPETAKQVKEAVFRFCQTKIDDNKIHLQNVLWSGLRTLPTSFVFLAICLFIGSLFGNGTFGSIPDWLGNSLNQGLTIIGWVSLTYPAETLLLEPIPIRRDTQVLTLLRDMPIEIEPRE
ncbi:MAG: hypothetical protein WC586_01570 [Methanoregula sp.]